MDLSPAVLERLAELSHESYLSHAGGSRTAEDGASWALLPPIQRRQNREQVQQMLDWHTERGRRVQRLDEASQLHDLRADGTGLDPREVEAFAMARHEQWCRTMLDAGWLLGGRSDDQRLHPCLVPWDELPEQEREKDRQPLRDLPGHLRSLGFVLVG